MKSNLAEKRDYVSSTNACKACMPLGASIAFKGVEGCVPFCTAPRAAPPACAAI